MPLDLTSVEKSRWIEEMKIGVLQWRWAGNLNLLAGSKRMREQNQVYKWLFKGTLSIDQLITMGCWEAVLVAGYKAKLFDQDYIRECLKPSEDKVTKIVQYLFDHPQKVEKPGEKGVTVLSDEDHPPRGAIVMWGKGEHVALSAGFQTDGHQIVELDRPSTETGVTTIEKKGAGGKALHQEFRWAMPPDIIDLINIPNIKKTASKPERSPLTVPIVFPQDAATKASTDL